jgi:hypothetical protein
MRAGFSFSYPPISLLLGQPLSIKKSYAGAIHPSRWSNSKTPKNHTDSLLSSVADPDPSDLHFLGLVDPDPDPLVRGMDPDPSITKQK